MRRIKILLIDDDEEDFILTRDILASGPEGDAYELFWCNRYEEAINAMLKSHYDLYLIDYRLGKHSGLELLHEAIESNCVEPLIILTGKGDKKIDEEALRLGAADYLTKDVLDYERLTRTIRYALRHNNTIGELKSNETKFRILFERSRDAIVITDAAGKVYEANNTAITLLETSLEGLHRKNISDFFANFHEFMLFNSKMQQYGNVKDMEIQINTSLGKTKACCIWSFIQISQHGNKELYYSVLHDISNHRQNGEKSTGYEKPDPTEYFTRIMASEIYNPLSSINFATEELKNNPDNYDPELLDIIKTNCERINQIASTLIDEVRRRQEYIQG